MDLSQAHILEEPPQTWTLRVGYQYGLWVQSKDIEIPWCEALGGVYHHLILSVEGGYSEIMTNSTGTVTLPATIIQCCVYVLHRQASGRAAENYSHVTNV